MNYIIDIPDLIPGTKEFLSSDEANRAAALRLISHPQLTQQVFECRRLPWQEISTCLNSCFVRDATEEDDVVTEDVEMAQGVPVLQLWTRMKELQARHMGVEKIYIRATGGASVVTIFLLALHLLLDHQSQEEPPEVPLVSFILSARDARSMATLGVLLDSSSVELRKTRMTVASIMHILDFYASQRFIGGHTFTLPRR